VTTHRPDLRALTSARGLAAWLVVLFHVRRSIVGLPAGAEALLAKGYLAVDFFFLLSGFVIALSAGDALRRQGPAAVPAFLRRRIARIWPLHLAMIGLALCLAAMLAISGRDTAMFPLDQLPAHLLLLQCWGLADPLRWNDPAWSISCELAAYLLFPLLVLAIDWRRLPWPVTVAAVGAMLVLLHLLFAAQGLWQLGQSIDRMGVVRCLLEFASGTAICALWQRWRGAWMAPAAAAMLLCAVLLGGWRAGWLPETLAVPPMLAALLLALALSACQRGNPLSIAPLHYLGEISYSTYLSHFLLWFAFKLAFLDGSQIGPAALAAYLLIVAAASVALHHLVERPAQQWINGQAIRPARSRPPARRSPRG
jgi:peptidoglycan/LPS O-acetylase OafA/YrhL